MVLGRLAMKVAKESLRGESIVILNCGDVIVTGNRKDISEKFEMKRSKVGSGQKGPKHSRVSEKIVKRAIRGMIPNHRRGRGKEAFKRIRCYEGVPKEFESAKKEEFKTGSKRKFITVKEIYKK